MCAVCPKCKEVVDYLYWNEEKHSFGTFDLKGYEEDGNSDIDTPNITFSCPECEEDLEFDEEDAKDFLENKDELKQMIEKKVKDERQ